MKKSQLLGATAAAAALVLAACGSGSGSSAGASNGSLSQTKLRIALGPDPAFAPIAVAMEKGWFKEAGFTEVTTQKFVAGVEAGQALVAGQIDVWQPASVPAISLINTGAPVKIVGEGSKCHVESLLVRPDSGVTKPEDLYNVQIGVLQGSSLNAYLGNLATHYNLDYKRLKVVNMAPAESLTALINGNIPAAVTFPPSTNRAMLDAKAIEVAGRTSGFTSDKGAKVDFSQTRCVIVMQDRYVEAHKDSAVAALAVIQRAKVWVDQNPNQAQEIYAKFSEQKLEDVKAAWRSYTFPKDLDSDFNGDLDAYSKFLKDTGALSKDPLPVDQLLNLAPLQEASKK